MNISQYIINKLSSFEYELDAAEVSVLLNAQGISPEQPLSVENMVAGKLIIAEFIPQLLPLPDVSQGKYSVKRNAEGLKAYYNLLCKELGIDNELDIAPVIRDRSSYW